MKDLYAIADILHNSDIRFIRRFYAAGEDSGFEEKRRLDLFEQILRKERLENEDCCKLIYGSAKSLAAFKKLKYRLKKDLFNILLVRDGPSEEQQVQAFRQAEVECRRMLLQGDLLLKRGAIDLGIKVIEKAHGIAEKNELLAEGILLGDILRTHKGYKKGIKVYEKYTEDIHKQLRLFKSVLEAKELNYRILLPHIFSKNLGKEFVEDADFARRKLAKYFEETDSPNIGYLYHLSNLYYYDLVKESDKALESAHQFLEHIVTHSAIFSNTRVANANLQIANILMHRGSFGKAIEYADQAVKLFKEGGNNQLTAIELLFLAQFRNGKYDKAEATLKRALKHSRIKKSSFTYDKWLYFHAGFKFSLGHYDESLKFLQADSALLADKSGWLFGHKLLEIMNFFEMQQFDLIEFRVESLRKLLQRQKNKNVARVKTIFRLLSLLARNAYDLTVLNKEGKEEMEKLRNGRDEFEWDATGFEFVRFDDWADEKIGMLNSVKYNRL